MVTEQDTAGGELLESSGNRKGIEQGNQAGHGKGSWWEAEKSEGHKGLVVELVGIVFGSGSGRTNG